MTTETVVRLIHQLGEGVLESSAFADDGWSSLSLVVCIEGAIAQHGFKYYPDGRTIPGSETSFETTFRFAELADAMQQLDGRRWKSCLLQIIKPELKVRMQYEYENAQRWRVTPANLDAMRESLRPTSG